MLSLSLWISFIFYAVLMYGIALRIQKMSMMDIVWSSGLGAGTIFIFLENENQSFSSWVALGLLLLWSTRMGLHLFFNRILCDKEDYRYQRLKDHSGASWKWVFLLCFLLQVLFISIFLFPIKVAIQVSDSSIGILQVFGLIIGCLALVGETLSDIQLDRFRTNPKNKKKVCKEGFWRYSRHPNYFFEWLFWFSFVGLASASEQFYISLIGPIFMYFFLRYITGVPFAELSSLESRGDAYKLYQKETNVFFPWFPKI